MEKELLSGCVSSHYNVAIRNCLQVHVVSLYRVAICSGKFPDFLMEAWDDYDYRKDSDNDRPGEHHDTCNTICDVIISLT